MKSKESLEWCCEAVMNNEKIPTVTNAYNANNFDQRVIISHRSPNVDAEARRGSKLLKGARADVGRTSSPGRSPRRQSNVLKAGGAIATPVRGRLSTANANSSPIRSPAKRQNS